MTMTMTMNISSFDDLLRAARQQEEPQRLLFVFARAELADDSTPEQRASFLAGSGGALVPLMSVDKVPEDISDFAALEQESCQFGHDWALVFVAALSGRQGVAPDSGTADRALERMMAAIREGRLSAFLAFDRRGEPVVFS